MALTKEDLQAIGGLMDSKLSAALEPIRIDIADLKQGQTAIQADISEIKGDIEEIKENVAALQYNVGKIGTWAERVSPKVDIGVYDEL